jgi:hypothetical protein
MEPARRTSNVIAGMKLTAVLDIALVPRVVPVVHVVSCAPVDVTVFPGLAIATLRVAAVPVTRVGRSECAGLRRVATIIETGNTQPTIAISETGFAVTHQTGRGDSTERDYRKEVTSSRHPSRRHHEIS